MIDPAMPYWEEFVELSAQQNAATDALSLLEESLAKASITDATRAVIQSQRYLALLAADQREEGIKILRELVKTEAMPRSGGDDAQAQLHRYVV